MAHPIGVEEADAFTTGQPFDVPDEGGAAIITATLSRNVGQTSMERSQVHAVKVELSVLLGRSSLPMRQLLRLGRGAEIALDTREGEELWILANNYPIARGEITIRDDRLCIVITRPADVNAFFAAA